jgi:hypothetical protein
MKFKQLREAFAGAVAYGTIGGGAMSVAGMIGTALHWLDPRIAMGAVIGGGLVSAFHGACAGWNNRIAAFHTSSPQSGPSEPAPIAPQRP